MNTQELRKETKEQRAERKSLYLARVLAMAHGLVDDDRLIKEAGEKFEDENRIMCLIRYPHDFEDMPCKVCHPEINQ